MSAALMEMKKGSLPYGISKRRIGRILLEGDFISHRDLEAAVALQAETNDRLGEILVRMGVLDPIELRAVLAIQKTLSTPSEAAKMAAGVRMMLGELLVAAQRLTQEQVDLALREQERTGEKLGSVLVRTGLLTQMELDAALAFQARQRGAAPAAHTLRLGELLAAEGVITREQLDDVLKRQKSAKQPKKIGELLVEAGYLKQYQVDAGLRLQHKLVTAALVAALSLASLAGVVPEAHAGGPGLTATIGITATVREYMNMQVLTQSPELVVTNADIRRGYVEVPFASRIRVKTNNASGYLLGFEIMSGPAPLFDSVNVTAGGKEFQLASSGGWIPQPYVRGGETLDISYRFMLSQGAQPGTYHWPLVLSVNSL